jgi:O-antigen/teichoic acid export membrane protein
MNTFQKIIKNIGTLSISYGITYILGFFILIYSARYLGVENFGILSFALAFTGIFGVFIDIGTSMLTTRELARDKSLTGKYISNLITIRIILSVIVFLTIALVINLLGYNETTIDVVYFIALYNVGLIFSQLFYAIFQAYQKMEYQALGNILYYVILFLGVLIIIHYQLSLIEFAIIYAIVGLIIIGYTFLMFTKKFFTPKLKFNFDFFKSIIVIAWPFAITGISINLYNWIDTILLSIIIGQQAVGLYNASYKLMLFLITIPIVINMALFPVMSKFYNSSHKSLKFSFEKLVKILSLISIPIGFGTLLLANNIINFIYGYQFIDSVIALQILIWSTVIIFIRNPYENLLESSNKQSLVSKAFVIGIIFNIIANLLIIPKYSYIGTSIVNVITDLIIFILLIYSTSRIDFSISRNIQISLVKITFASLLMDLIIKCIINLNIFLTILIGIIIYLIIIISLRVLDDTEKQMIRSIFNK